MKSTMNRVEIAKYHVLHTTTLAFQPNLNLIKTINEEEIEPTIYIILTTRTPCCNNTGCLGPPDLALPSGILCILSIYPSPVTTYTQQQSPQSYIYRP